MSYAKEFLGIEILSDPVINNCIQTQKDLRGPQEYTIDHKCGHCGRDVAGIVAAKHADMHAQWLACPSCKHGSVSNNGIITPTPLLEDDIKGLEDPIKNTYPGAQKSTSSKSYIAYMPTRYKIIQRHPKPSIIAQDQIEDRAFIRPHADMRSNERTPPTFLVATSGMIRAEVGGQMADLYKIQTFS